MPSLYAAMNPTTRMAMLRVHVVFPFSSRAHVIQSPKDHGHVNYEAFDQCVECNFAQQLRLHLGRDNNSHSEERSAIRH